MKKVYGCLLTVVLAVTPAFSALVAHWDFTNGYNDAAGSLNGTAVGTVSIVDAVYTGFSATGKTNFTKAVQTASSGLNLNYLNIGNLGSLGIYTNSFTISLCVKRASFSGTTPAEFWESYSGTSTVGYEGVQMSLRASGQTDPGKAYSSVGGNNTKSPALLKGGTIANDTWHWIVIRYDGDTDALKYFEDGVNLTNRNVTVTASLAQQAARDARIGDGFGGLIADVRIYDTALTFTADGSNVVTDGEIFGIYNQIPEPATLGMLLVGAVLVRLFGKRKG